MILWRILLQFLERNYSICLSRKKYVHSVYDDKVKGLKNDTSVENCIRNYWGKIKPNYGIITYYNSLYPGSDFDPRFVPDDLFYCYVDPYFNNPIGANWLDNKNYYNMLFPDINQPTTLGRVIGGVVMNKDYSPSSIEEIKSICKSHDEVIFKKAIDSEGGKGVEIISPQSNHFDKKLSESKNVIIQSLVKQHHSLAALHSSSINTIRIMSLLWKGEVYILSTILRMGQGGSRVDNASSGGLFCGIDENEELRKYAYDANHNKCEYHPSSSTVFSNHKIPGIKECWKVVKSAAPRLSAVSKLVSWDFSIGEDGKPILIEVNLSYGSIRLHQMTNGPLFKDLTREVMQEVFADKRKFRLYQMFK